jgi:hypothetical protein
MQLIAKDYKEKVIKVANAAWVMQIAISSSIRNNIIGIGRAI